MISKALEQQPEVLGPIKRRSPARARDHHDDDKDDKDDEPRTRPDLTRQTIAARRDEKVAGGDAKESRPPLLSRRQ